MQPILTALKDIPGVVGSFVLDARGTLLAREMPAIYPDMIFPEVGRRLASVSEALDTQMSPYQEMMLKFDSYWLVVRRSGQCFLNILTTESVNYPALRMATNVALKQLSDRVAAAPSLVVPAPVIVEEPEPIAPAVVETPAAPLPPAEPKRRRMWRGQVVDW